MEKELITLVEKAMKGDREAFGQVIQKKQREILYITSRYSNPQDVEDYSQEALILMYKKLKQLKDPKRFDVWMYSIVRNTCYYGNRKKLERNKIAEVKSVDPHSPNILNTIKEEREEFLPTEFVENEEKRAVLMEEIKALPQHYQECLLLFFYEDMSYAEIAEALGISTRKVGNTLLRAKEALRKRVTETAAKDVLYSIPAVGAIPVMSQIFYRDAERLIPQDMCDRVTANVMSHVDQLTAAGSSAVAGWRAVVKSKVFVGFTSVVVVSGLTISGLHALRPEAGRNITGNQEASAVVSTAKKALPEVAPQETPPEVPINTLADMIGAEQEARLLEFEAQGVKPETWMQFLKEIGAGEKSRSSTTKEEEYILYLLEKQDKQLLLVSREQSGSDLLSVKHQFGVKEEIPEMMYFILMFDE